MDFVKVTGCAVLVVLALSDVRSRRLPNRWVASFAALYPAGAYASGTSITVFGAHFAVAVLALAVAVQLFRLGWVGGGDVKLAAAVFLWCGPQHALFVLLIVSVCGTLIGLVVLVTARLREHMNTSATVALKPSVPYGIALAAGGVVAVLSQPATRALATHVGLV